VLHNDPGCHLQLSAHFNLHHAGDRRRAAPERDVGDVDLGHGLEQFNRDSPDELGSGANCSDFLDCLEVPTRDKGDFRHSRLLHGVRGSVWPFCVAFGRTPPVGCR